MSFSDADLIARVIDRDDRHAFGELVRRHQSQVRSLLRRLTCGDESLADDLAQDTFVRAFKGMRSYRGGAKFSSWLYRIAYNVFLSTKSRARLDTEELQEDVVEESQSTSSQSNFRQDLVKAMQVLNPTERATLALAYGAQSTHEEIAVVLSCPLGTVKTNVARAKEKLRARLKGWAHARLS